MSCLPSSSTTPPTPHGVPEIEVTFDINANDYRQIKSPSPTTRVGCLLRRSSAFNEAEKDKAEDEAAAARVQAKNSLESYTYSLCNSITNEKLADKFEPADKLKLESCVNETISAFIATSVFIQNTIHYMDISE
ncbi:hypothetical protein DFH29DRAFT_1043256 [Suillus ampliporus]|nr:hypothetical protein DFH29DRAFT_1043256 [Suillus ampliporus]